MVEAARAGGCATFLFGGARPPMHAWRQGAFYLPTVIAGIDNRTAIAQQEIFGPVLCVLPFDDEEDLIAQANDSVYGLAAGIWTRGLPACLARGAALEAGTVWINTYKQLSHLHAVRWIQGQRHWAREGAHRHALVSAGQEHLRRLGMSTMPTFNEDRTSSADNDTIEEQLSETSDTIGFIGVGVMGEPMCRNLARKSGLPVIALDRDPAPLQRLGCGRRRSGGFDPGSLSRRPVSCFCRCPRARRCDEVAAFARRFLAWPPVRSSSISARRRSISRGRWRASSPSAVPSSSMPRWRAPAPRRRRARWRSWSERMR